MIQPQPAISSTKLKVKSTSYTSWLTSIVVYLWKEKAAHNPNVPYIASKFCLFLKIFEIERKEGIPEEAYFI